MAERIIPADAGSTSDNHQKATSAKDHPRGCGEHLFDEIEKAGDRGSSPRMRGAR